MGLRKTLLLALILFVVILILPLWYLHYTDEKSSLIGLSKENTSHEMLHIKDDLISLFDIEIEKAIAITVSPSLEHAVLDSNRYFESLSRETRNATIIDLNNRWMKTPNQEDDFIQQYLNNQAASYLKAIKNKITGHYGELFITNKFGALVGSSDRLTTLAHGHKYWWKEAFANNRGNTFIDDRGYDESVGGYVVGIVVPMMINGEVAAILKCNVNILHALKPFVTNHTKHNNQAKITRLTGEIVVGGSLAPLSESLPPNITDKIHENTDQEIIVIDSESSYFTASYINFVGGNGFRFGGEEESIDHKKGNTSKGWLLVFENEYSAVLSDLRQISEQTLISVSLVGTFALMLTVLFAYRFTRPLVLINKSIKIIGEGNFDIHIPYVDKGDEVGELSRAFTEMVQNLKRVTTSREKLKEQIERNIESEKSLRLSEARNLELAKDALHLSESYSNSLYMNVPFPVFSWKRKQDNYVLDSINQSTIDLSKGAIESFVGSIAKDFYKDDPKILEFILKAAQGGSVTLKRYLYTCRDTGLSRTVDIHFRAAPEDIVFIFLVDISHMITIENRLRESEERVRSMFDILPVGITMTDPRGNIVDCNPESERLLGISKEDQLARNCADKTWKVRHLDGRDMLPEEFPSVQALKNNINVRSVEMEVKKSRGSILLSVSATPINHPDLGVLVAYTDITSRKQADLALNEANVRLKTATQSARIGVWEWNIIAKTLVWNELMYEVYGVESSSFTPTYESWKSLVHPDDIAKTEEHLSACIDNDYPFNMTFRITDQDNNVKFIAATGSVVRSANGEAVSFIGVNHDITLTSNYEKNLLRARQEAEYANQAKSEFLANMSHEIRTPMNGVMGMIQLLETTTLNKEQREYATIALESTESLIGLINDILDLSKVEAGRLELTFSSFDLPKLLKSITNVFKVQTNTLGIELNCKIDTTIPRVISCDQKRLRQILFNLIGNAVKFTDSGNVTLQLKQTQSSRNGEYRILCSVSDTGCGIPEDFLERIFEPFTQVDGSSSRTNVGTGLGLAIVKRLVGLLGGSIKISSTIHKGTIVEFSFVCHEGSLDDFVSQDIVPEKNLEKTGSLKVLVAEDNSVNSTVVRKMLEKLGHFALCARNGQEALNILKDREVAVDVVLMDIQMPVMDGREAVRIIRNDSEYEQVSHLPIIALTAHGMAGDRERFIADGMDDYLVKPLDMKKLKSTLLKFMEG